MTFWRYRAINMNYSKLFIFITFLYLMGCSAAYEKVKEINLKNPVTFQDHLVNNYQQNAIFEADEMHDWNSAKLYSEKALRAQQGDYIYPEKISYWKIPENRFSDIKTAHASLLSIYNDAIKKDPINLAIAISSLDCWSEQEEEQWQSWDIKKCKNIFHASMHEIYKKISTIL